MRFDAGPRALADMLVAGGDHRMRLGPDGISTFGCTPYPRDTVPFSSCTASTPSPRAWAAAQEGATEIEARLAHDRPADVAAAMCEGIRQDLAAVLGLGRVPGAAVVLSPSGTPSELVALLLATVGTEGAVVSVIPGPNEVGGGTPAAAAGRYFDRVVPSGADREEGRPVDADLTNTDDMPASSDAADTVSDSGTTRRD